MTDNIIISFTGIGHGLDGIPKEEFLKIKSFSNYDSMFIIDKDRSWYNNIDTDSIINQIKNYKNVITLGNSMGGFNAIMFANFFPVNKIIAFASQFSIHPEIVPWEKRWKKFQTNITSNIGWKYKNLKFNNVSKYFLVSGDAKKELKHLDMMPNQSNIKKIIIKGAGHNVASDLKKQKKLYQLITECMEENEI